MMIYGKRSTDEALILICELHEKHNICIDLYIHVLLNLYLFYEMQKLLDNKLIMMFCSKIVMISWQQLIE